MIQLENRQKNKKIEETSLKKVAQKILNDLACPDGELSVVIVDDDQIREINRDYLQRDWPTNVISFAMREGEDDAIHPELLGDVVISADTAARDAVDADLSFESELYFLLLHGILHLFGYDHERGTEEEACRMEEKERTMFAAIQAEFLTSV